MTHLSKLFNKICKYDTDPASIVEDIDQTRFGLQTDIQTDFWTMWNQYTPHKFVGAWVEVGGKIMALFTNE